MSKEENKVTEVQTTEEEIKELTAEEKQEFIDRAEEQTEEAAELRLTKEETVMFNRLMGNYNGYDVEKTLTRSFEGIFRNTKLFVEATESYAAAMGSFLKNSEIYNTEFIKNKQGEINGAFNSEVNTYGELVQSRLQDIKVNLLAKAQQLPLGSVEFNTAFNLINVAGKNINDNTLQQIAEQFRGDLASLKALKSTAKAFGAAGASYFDDLIFDPVQTVGKLQLQAMDLFNNYPNIPGVSPAATSDTMPKDVGNLKYKAILFGKNLEKLTELANIEIMPWYTEIVKAEEAEYTAFMAGFNSGADGGFNNELVSGAIDESMEAPTE